MYTGDGNKISRPESESDLGATSNIVLHLSRIIPRQYHGNIYAAIPLMVLIAKVGIFSLEIVRRNRLPKCKLPSEASMKKEERGQSYEHMTTINGADTTSVIWKDNKHLISCCSLKLILRYFLEDMTKKQHKTLAVKCSKIVRVQQYNRHMGGVVLLHSLVGRYKILIKSRSW